MSMPHDPFSNNEMDLTEFAANMRNMYTSLMGAGFTQVEALEITIRFLTSMVKKLWAGIKTIPMTISCSCM